MSRLARAWNSPAAAWAAALVLVAGLYASLPWGPEAVRMLRRARILEPVILLVLGLAVVLLGALLLRCARRVGPRAALLAVLALPLGMAVDRLAQWPQERVHLVLYSLVGVAWLRATLRTFPSLPRAYLAAALLGVACGWGDEIVQGWLPNRRFDERDILVNSLSVLLGLYAAAALQGHLGGRRR